MCAGRCAAVRISFSFLIAEEIMSMHKLRSTCVCEEDQVFINRPVQCISGVGVSVGIRGQHGQEGHKNK